MNIRTTLSLVLMIILLCSCSSEVKEQEQEQEQKEVEKVAPEPLVVQVSEDPAPPAVDGVGNSIDENGLIKWYLGSDANIDDYQIQQHKWNKWVNVGSLKPEELKGDHYEIEVKLLVGKNIYRVSKKGRAKKRVPPVEINVKPLDLNSTISWKFNTDQSAILISEEAMYEIFNEAGELMDKGTAAEIDISILGVGGYYFNYALSMDSFQKK